MCVRERGGGQRGVSVGLASPDRWDLTDELSQVGSPGKSLKPHHDFIGNCSPLPPSPPPRSPPCCRPPSPLQASSFRSAPLPSPTAVPGSAPGLRGGGAGSG